MDLLMDVELLCVLLQVLLWYLADAGDQWSGYERVSGRTVASAFKSVQQYERAARNLLLHHQIQGRGENRTPNTLRLLCVSLNWLGFLVLLCRCCRRWRGMNSPAVRDWGLNWSMWSTPWLFPADPDCLHQDKTTRWCRFCVVFGCFVVECGGRLHTTRTKTLCPVLKRQWGRLGRLMKSRANDHDGSKDTLIWLCLFYYFVQMLSTLRSLVFLLNLHRLKEELPPSHKRDASVLTFTYSSVDEGECHITQMTKRRKKSE